MAQPLKQRVNSLITKLADRDTYSLAAAELNSIASTLDAALLPAFLSCILSTNSSDKSAVRKQCLHVISILASSHNLSPYITKILNNLIRNLRDKNSSIQSTCISTISILPPRVSSSAFVTMLKLLSEALYTEQDANAQVGAALCLAAAIDAAPDPDEARLGKMVARLERLVKNEGFKAKAAGLVVIGSVIGAGAAGGSGIKGLVNFLLGFISSADWAARKAAVEALGKLAMAEKDAVMEFKANCLKVFESKRFDKVKAVREVMNQTIETWKSVPDTSEEVSPPPRSQCSSKEDGSDERYSRGSMGSCAAGLNLRKKLMPNKSTLPDSSLAATARKRSPFKNTDSKASAGMLRNMKHNKPNAASSLEDGFKEGDKSLSEWRKNENARFSKSEAKRALFSRNDSDDKMQKFGGLRSGSRVAPCLEECPLETIVVSNNNENLHTNHKDSEDLSLIRSQLVQIEKQQSSLLDLLQRFIGSSQQGMHALETRVHGLELALDDISYDLAVSTGRMSRTDSHGTSCCLLPGADFWSSKFWKKTEGRYSTPRFSSSTGTLAAMRYKASKNTHAEMPNRLENCRSRLQGGGGFIVNPLAEIHTDFRGISEIPRQ